MTRNNETSYLEGKVRKWSLPVLAPPTDVTGPKRLRLPQGELANFYDDPEGIRYIACIELREGTIRGNHWHRIKEEQIYVISGEVVLVARDGESGPQVSLGLRAGDRAVIVPGVIHALKTEREGHAIEFSEARFDPSDIQRFKLL